MASSYQKQHDLDRQHRFYWAKWLISLCALKNGTSSEKREMLWSVMWCQPKTQTQYQIEFEMNIIVTVIYINPDRTKNVNQFVLYFLNFFVIISSLNIPFAEWKTILLFLAQKCHKNRFCYLLCPGSNDSWSWLDNGIP